MRYIKEGTRSGGRAECRRRPRALTFASLWLSLLICVSELDQSEGEQFSRSLIRARAPFQGARLSPLPTIGL